MPSSSSTPPPDQRSNAEIRTYLLERASRDDRTGYHFDAKRMRAAARALVASPGPGVDENGLLPCPLACGGKGIHEFDDTMTVPYGHMVVCSRCAMSTGSCRSAEQAAESWNRRPSPPAAAGVVTVEMVASALSSSVASSDGKEHKVDIEILANSLNALLSAHQPVTSLAVVYSRPECQTSVCPYPDVCAVNDLCDQPRETAP